MNDARKPRPVVPAPNSLSGNDTSSDDLRREIFARADTIVLKVGTRVVTHSGGVLNHDRIGLLAEELHALRSAGKRVVLVSSGAVGAGMSTLGLTSRPTDLAQLQAVAAVGQTKLMDAYDRVLARFGYHSGQVLLTADDVNDRARYLNVRNTLHSLLRFNAIPIINENDTVSVEELMTTFGDNDRLAAMVASLLRAQLLIIFSDVDGLFDGDPSLSSSRVISTVATIDATVQSYVRDKKTGLSKGGMASKLEAARICTTAGENVIIANGHAPGVIQSIIDGKPVGTLFVAQGSSLSPLQRWIGFSARPRGKVVVDEGACRALVRNGKSLLAAGILDVEGDFRKGDVISICDENQEPLARGLSNYGAADIQRIKGLKSNRIAQVLGHRPYEEVVHRDNLAVVRKLTAKQ